MRKPFCIRMTAPEVEEMRTLMTWALSDTGSNERARRCRAVQRELSKIRLVEPLPGTEQPVPSADTNPDPDGQNADRAEWADAALRAFQAETGTDDDDMLADLLCDLLHWCDRQGVDFDPTMSRAVGHYVIETIDPEAG